MRTHVAIRLAFAAAASAHGLAALLLAASLAAGAVHAQNDAASLIELQPIESLALPDRQTASAAVLAPNDALIAAEVAAAVSAVHTDAGRSVERGALLVSLDERDARLALQQAEAQLRAAQARLTLATQRAERGRRLRAERHLSEDELLALETGLDAAQAELELARAARDIAARQLEKCAVRAPFAGVVLERQAQVGALAAPGTPLLRLVSTAAPEVEARLAPEAAARLEGGREIVFVTAGQRYPLRLEALSPLLERSARTRLARFAFTADTAPAGSTGQIEWTSAALLLPAELMVKRGGQLGAFIDAAGAARFVPAEGAEEGRPFRLEVPAGTRVVRRGQQGLNEGDALPVLEP
ncbi:MAG: efflux RND transporter periplasmic adaptor subunit [Xanthomonadales bacterium]|nr:efflux RND transporter periplasmic adaptor subunit [Xanthomonadales bacterium]